MQIKGKVTSFDIAHLTGVSQSTVSRALRGSPLVNEETRRRIQVAVDQLNYKVDKNASGLRARHTGTLALLLFEDPTADESHINPFFLSMLGSITRASAQRGYDLLISFQQFSRDWHADYADTKKAASSCGAATCRAGTTSRASTSPGISAPGFTPCNRVPFPIHCSSARETTLWMRTIGPCKAGSPPPR